MDFEFTSRSTKMLSIASQFNRVASAISYDSRERRDPMFGVPSDLDLSFLVGAELHQVHLMPYQLNLVFEPDARFFIEGVWELMASDGTEIDRYRPWPRTEPYQFHRLLGRKIVGWTVTSPISLSLRFDDGSVFRLVDSSTQYESFMIEPGCIIV